MSGFGDKDAHFGEEDAHFGEEDDYAAAGIVDAALGDYLSEQYPCTKKIQNVEPPREEEKEEDECRLSKREKEARKEKCAQEREYRKKNYTGKSRRHVDKKYLTCPPEDEEPAILVEKEQTEVETDDDKEQEDKAQRQKLHRKQDETKMERKSKEASRLKKAATVAIATTRLLRPVTKSKGERKKEKDLSERISLMKAKLETLQKTAPTDSQIPEIMENIKAAQTELDELMKPSSSGGSQQKYLKYKIKYLRSQLITWK